MFMQCTILPLDTLSERRALLLIVPGLVERRFPDKCLQRTGKILAHAFERGARGRWSVYSEFRKYTSKLVTLAAQSVVDDKLV